MKNILAVIAIGMSLQSAQALNCSDNLDRVTRQVRKAEFQLQSRTEMLDVYSELASDARTSSQISTGLMSVSAAVLTGGVFIGGLSGVAGGSSAIPTIDLILAAVIGKSKAAVWGVLLTPTILTIGAVGTGLTAEVALPSRIKDDEKLIDQLIGADKNFDDAQRILDQERLKVNLDYSQATDVLGLRDRRMTRKLQEIASHSKEVAELRLAHSKIVLGALNQACESSK
jgi:hypothetical protein